MPKPPTHPRLFDRHALRVNIGDLGSLKSFQQTEGVSRVVIESEIDGKTCTQTVSIVGLPKPFGGFQYYFVCAITGKRCRTLYRFGNRYGGRFAHREAFPDACYSIQTLSRSDRTFATKHRTEEALKRVGLKAVYAGQPTRRYSVLVKRLQRARQAEAAILFGFTSRFS